MEKINLDGSDIVFSRDALLQFDEAAHSYSVEGYGDMAPVSSVIAKFFDEFDAQYWSLRKCKDMPNPEIAAAKLRDEWNSKGRVASQAGTFMHKQIEDFLNGKEEIETLCQVCYKGDYVEVCDTIDISREWNYFQAFYMTQREAGFTPFRTEWRVYDIDARMAGTIDLVCACGDGTYEIYDWKRSNKVDPEEYNRWHSGKNGLEHLTDTSYIHYCLQQNLYRYMLERNYGIRISRMNLVVLHPQYSGYRIVPVPRMDKEVGIILSKLG